ncbi:MAG: ribonuclease III [Clostridiales bacterium]|nr:ribonuclease III [Clostridiales bacterium]
MIENININNKKNIETALHYSFQNETLLLTALTHSSYTNEMKSRGVVIECNERLEFLGDSILQIISSEMLFTRFPDLPEGDLSRIRSQIVCEKALNSYAAKIKLGEFLQLGHGEEMNQGRQRPSILADAFEALIAAVYLDSNLDAVKQFLLPFLIEEVSSIELSKKGEDAKSRLQEIIQQERNEKFEYVLIEESGPAHDRVFKVEARLNRNVIGTGSGKSKREAEQNAAAEALRLFGEDRS